MKPISSELSRAIDSLGETASTAIDDLQKETRELRGRIKELEAGIAEFIQADWMVTVDWVAPATRDELRNRMSRLLGYKDIEELYEQLPEEN